MKRSGFLRRFTGLVRRTRLKVRGKPRFKDGRDPLWIGFIRTLPCILVGHPNATWGCRGRTECCHVKTRSTGGADRGNTFPACGQHHTEQHTMGILSFQMYYGIDLEGIAKELSDRETW
jgi:hypothetical protein